MSLGDQDTGAAMTGRQHVGAEEGVGGRRRGSWRCNRPQGRCCRFDWPSRVQFVHFVPSALRAHRSPTLLYPMATKLTKWLSCGILSVPLHRALSRAPWFVAQGDVAVEPVVIGGFGCLDVVAAVVALADIVLDDVVAGGVEDEGGVPPRGALIEHIASSDVGPGLGVGIVAAPGVAAGAADAVAVEGVDLVLLNE